MRRSATPLREFGWRAPTRIRAALGFAPLVLVVGLVLAIVLVEGTDTTPAMLALGVLLAVLVGLAEEAWYRGLVLRALLPKGEATAVLGSAGLFSVVHAASLLGGAELVATALQLAFALLFGLVTALLVLRTGSLWPGIAWHAAHNAISFASRDAFTPMFVVGYSLTAVVLIAYAIVLRRRRGS